MAGKLGRALVLLVLLAAALITQAPLAVFLLAFALVLLVLLRLDAAYLRRQVTAELLVPDKPVIQGEDFTLTVRLRNRSRLPIPALVVLLNAADEWGGGQITLRCAAMLGGRGERRTAHYPKRRQKRRVEHCGAGHHSAGSPGGVHRGMPGCRAKPEHLCAARCRGWQSQSGNRPR